MNGTCAYCFQVKALSKSHAIPNAFFKDISKNNQGQLVAIPSGEAPIHLSQDSATSYILCADCEALFNKSFDMYLVYHLRKWNEGIIKQGLSYRHEVDAEAICRGILAVAWRASISGHNFYDPARVNWHHLKIVRDIISTKSELALKQCSMSVYRLKDKASLEDGALSQDLITQIVTPVQATKLRKRGKPYKDSFGFEWVMAGFIFRVTIPRLGFAARSGPEYLKIGMRYLHARPVYFLDYIPLRNKILHSVDKERRGQTTLRG